ncbi:nascent polypeptide-associated complex subunit alpha, muscle-specific form-like isoform X4 [Melopsittacus undulatus]|uniref:nascent polypeptide-associated complex subunit alpha, muscle-specific form-like isoform X4 n=1 Tax=Melopsittacus undulatus TaxID=13146 RepID=UPI00146B1CB7|nr:nascent polypeptide-associated complex subunit alpha, muscle-specific form-like isoform X4 [Melopsittacus undulatus]
MGAPIEAYGDTTTPMAPNGTPQRGYDIIGVTHSDVIMGVTNPSGVTQSHRDPMGAPIEAYGDATTPIAPNGTPQGGDDVMGVTHSDVIMRGTDPCRVTMDHRDPMGAPIEAYGDATTPIAPNGTPQGGDDVMVGTHSDVIMGVTDQSGVTQSHRDPIGAPIEAYGDATTPIAPNGTPRGSDDVIESTHSDVIMGVTQPSGVTMDHRDPIGAPIEAYGDATTPIAPNGTPQGGDDVIVGTHSDVIMGGTHPSGVTIDPKVTMGAPIEAYGDATTPIAPNGTPQGGDDVMGVTHSDVIMKGTDSCGVTMDHRDPIGAPIEAYGDATTPIAPNGTPQGDYDVMGVTHSDVIMGVTHSSGVTRDHRDPMGAPIEAYGDATTPIAPNGTPQGVYDVIGVTHSDVIMGVTDQPGVTQSHRDPMGVPIEAYGDATTPIAPNGTPRGGDDVIVGTHSDVIMGVTQPTGVTQSHRDPMGAPIEAYGDATTPIAPNGTPQGDYDVMGVTHSDVIMGGTHTSGVTESNRDPMGAPIEAYGDATTPIAPNGTPHGGDDVMGVTHSDVIMSGTHPSGVTMDHRDPMGAPIEAYGDATTPIAPNGTPHGGYDVTPGTHSDVIMRGTDPCGVTMDHRDPMGAPIEAYGDATTPIAPNGTPQGGDDVMGVTHSDVIMGVTHPSKVTMDPKVTMGVPIEAYGDAITPMSPNGTPQGGYDVMGVTHSDVIMRGTHPSGVTTDHRDPMGAPIEAYGDATTPIAAYGTPQGGDDVMGVTHSDVIMGVTHPPDVTMDHRDPMGAPIEAYGDATTPIAPNGTPRGGDDVIGVTHSDVIMGGTHPSGVTQSHRVPMGAPTEAYGDATTPMAPNGTPQRGDDVMGVTHSDVIMGVTHPPDVTMDPKATMGAPIEAYGEATTPIAPNGTPHGGDDVMGVTHSDVIMGVTDQSGVTQSHKDPMDAPIEAYGEATTPIAPNGTPQGGYDVIGVTHSDVIMGGTHSSGVTQSHRDPMGAPIEAYGDATTPIAPNGTPQGGYDVMGVTHSDVIMGVTHPSEVTQSNRDPMGAPIEAYGAPPTPVGPTSKPRPRDDVTARPSHGCVVRVDDDPPPPPPPSHVFPVTLGPRGAAPPPLRPLPLLLLPLPLLLR